MDFQANLRTTLSSTDLSVECIGVEYKEQSVVQMKSFCGREVSYEGAVFTFKIGSIEIQLSPYCETSEDGSQFDTIVTLQTPSTSNAFSLEFDWFHATEDELFGTIIKSVEERYKVSGPYICDCLAVLHENKDKLGLDW
jgi:hypothetical protein